MTQLHEEEEHMAPSFKNIAFLSLIKCWPSTNEMKKLSTNYFTAVMKQSEEALKRPGAELSS